jgi:hypothetical protein
MGKTMWIAGGIVAVGGVALYVLHQRSVAVAEEQQRTSQAVAQAQAQANQAAQTQAQQAAQPQTGPVAAVQAALQALAAKGASLIPPNSMNARNALQNIPAAFKAPSLVKKTEMSVSGAPMVSMPFLKNIPRSFPSPNFSQKGVPSTNLVQKNRSGLELAFGSKLS